jgi:hypothetical protein
MSLSAASRPASASGPAERESTKHVSKMDQYDICELAIMPYKKHTFIQNTRGII